jgi:hypothetical protein
MMLKFILKYRGNTAAVGRDILGTYAIPFRY